MSKPPTATDRRSGAGRGANPSNKLNVEDGAAHRWYRFVLSYPPHLVRDYLQAFAAGTHSLVLDPFCGTGTTLVEAKKLGVPSVGLEAHPLLAFASRVKLDWTPSAGALQAHAQQIAESASSAIAGGGPSRTLDTEQMRLLLKDSISPLPLHKILVLRDTIDTAQQLGGRTPAKPVAAAIYDKEKLALAAAAITSSNLHFGPEVGVRGHKEDAEVLGAWREEIEKMVADLRVLAAAAPTPASVFCADARAMTELIEPASVSCVICSPPYPNEKDYTRTVRLETVLLGYTSDRAQLRALKQGLLRSNTRGVYKTDDDSIFVAGNARIQEIAHAIEERRIALGKTSGFERLYARVTQLYFGGMARHFMQLRPLLTPGARLAYVVGDQASYLRVMIRTGQILGELAIELGYEIESLDLFRTRISTATREQLREEVLVLRWPG